MKQEYIDTFEAFCKEPKEGQYLMFQEYYELYSGTSYPIVDVVTFYDNMLEDEDDVVYDIPGTYRVIQNKHIRVRGWCESAGHDGWVDLEIWSNGEVYLSGDGIGPHGRLRVVGMAPTETGPVLASSSEVTDYVGNPVNWDVWTQGSCEDTPGIKVEMHIHIRQDNKYVWDVRKEFAEDQEGVDKLVAFARAEFAKPKYFGRETKITVDGKEVSKGE